MLIFCYTKHTVSSRCKSAPAPNFTWSKNGAKLPVNTSTKYFAEYHKLDPVTYTSVLLISDVSSSDYGSYECGARNDLGFSTTSVKLDITSAPGEKDYALFQIPFHLML